MEKAVEPSHAATGRSVLKRRHIAAAAIGNALEFYDFIVYSFFSIQIGRAFFPVHSAYGSLMLSLATFGSGFVTRPIGAIVIGNYSDRAGRRPAMMLCFVLIGCAIIGMAIVPPYASIGIAAPILAVIARMLQGFSLGGEIGSNTAFLLEVAPEHKRAFILSCGGATQYLAPIAGGSVGVLLTAVLSPGALDAYGWRIAFLLGAAVVPFGFWMRSNLPETLHTTKPVAAVPVAEPSRLRQAHTHWRVMILGMIVLGTATIGTYIFSYLVTYAQATLHLPARAGFIAETGGNVLAIPAVLLGGWLSDRYGRWPVHVWGNLVVLLTIYPAFAWISAAGSQFALIASMTLLNGFSGFIWGSFYASLAESLPESIRSSGFGVVYSVSIAIAGGTTQVAVTWLIHITGSPMAPAWLLFGATALGQIALMLIPESAPVRSRLSPQLPALMAREANGGFD